KLDASAPVRGRSCSLLACCGPRRDLLSFPTRRSSDLRQVHARALQVRHRRLAGGVGVRQIRDRDHVRVAPQDRPQGRRELSPLLDRKSTRLNSSHVKTSYAVFCLKKKKIEREQTAAFH